MQIKNYILCKKENLKNYLKLEQTPTFYDMCKDRNMFGSFLYNEKINLQKHINIIDATHNIINIYEYNEYILVDINVLSGQTLDKFIDSFGIEYFKFKIRKNSLIVDCFFIENNKRNKRKYKINYLKDPDFPKLTII